MQNIRTRADKYTETIVTCRPAVVVVIQIFIVFLFLSVSVSLGEISPRPAGLKGGRKEIINHYPRVAPCQCEVCAEREWRGQGKVMHHTNGLLVC